MTGSLPAYYFDLFLSWNGFFVVLICFHSFISYYSDIKSVVCAIFSVANLGIASVAHARIVARFL
mgnify:FL=1